MEEAEMVAENLGFGKGREEKVGWLLEAQSEDYKTVNGFHWPKKRGEREVMHFFFALAVVRIINGCD